jgi:hypothetical protein
MRRNVLTALALAAGLLAPALAPAVAQAQTKPFGAGFDGWEFTATRESKTIVNCRAVRRAGGREDILAMRSDRHTYISINGEGRNGKWPKSVVAVPGKPKGVADWSVTAQANGARLWFLLDYGAVSDIANAGVFTWSLMDSEDDGKVNLGKRSADAWERVNQCVNANGG